MGKVDKALQFANKEKMVTGTSGAISNKIGIPAGVVRGGFVAAALITNPFIGVAAYGAAFAYRKFKK